MTAGRPIEFDYTAAAHRMERIMWALSAAGILTLAFMGRVPASAGFLAGSVLGILNFRWMKRAVSSLGTTAKPPRIRSAVFLGMRYLLIALVLYAMMKFFGISLKAVLAGLLVPVAAIVLEILFELFYERT